MTFLGNKHSKPQQRGVLAGLQDEHPVSPPPAGLHGTPAVQAAHLHGSNWLFPGTSHTLETAKCVKSRCQCALYSK